MPVHAEGTKIIETATGRVKGHSRTPAMAKRAARVRNAVVYGGFKPTHQRKGPSRRVSY